MTTPTRQRLVRAARTLFSEQGYERTSVGDIEARAGFTPRGGTLYKHFEGKAAILDAVMHDAVGGLRDGHAAPEATSDLGTDIAALAHQVLAALDHEREISLLIDKSGTAAPELAAAYYRAIAEPGFRWAAGMLDQRLPGPAWDHEALAVLLVGAVVNYRRSQWTFGTSLLDVDEDRLVGALRHLVTSARAGGQTRDG